MKRCRLSINCDHIATLRNARGGVHPDPMRAVALILGAGADGITFHLREDRRHITDDDARALCGQTFLPVNMEMALTDEMERVALTLSPSFCCLVPEKRMELTTEGGLDAVALMASGVLAARVARLRQAGIRVFLFVECDEAQIEAAAQAGADGIELHTGAFAEAVTQEARKAHLEQIERCAMRAQELGLECHGGHGLNFENVAPIARIAPIEEVSIGHFLMGEAVFIGLGQAVTKMRQLIDHARRA